MIEGTYEYCGIQRTGKSTKMVADLYNKLVPEYGGDNVFCNFRVFMAGVHCLSTEDLVAEVFNMKELKVRHKVIVFDEAGQFMIAGEYRNKDQTRFVNFAWQMPKRDIVLLYASNVGNSADVILRDATWITIMPRYVRGEDYEDDYIESTVIWNYDCVMESGYVLPEVHRYHRLFDSYEPIE